MNYIVDFTEADFADKLVKEINGELPETLKLDANELDRIAKLRGVDSTQIFIDMLQKSMLMRIEYNYGKQKFIFCRYLNLYLA